MKGEALAEYIVVKNKISTKNLKMFLLKRLPPFLTGGTTAIYLLNKSKVKAGDDILINEASGGV
jgi:NADPH:quinone reductase-like Zn-dependent oxidoreductase